MLGSVEMRSVSPVFVGRADELGALNDALARAAAGEPQALVVGGEAGVGKTRLVEEFGAVAERQGAVVAVGGCVEIGADGLPFAPFSTALRALRRALPEELATAAAGQEEELARLLPELGETARGRHDEEGTARLFELTARLLERVADGRTVVVVIEDLHWADTSTRHLLAYLFRTLRTGRLLVLATYRSDDIHRRHPLRPLLAELDRLRTVRRIELARFTREEVGRQIAGILAAEPDPAQVDEIFERSDGNAFFVEELAVACSEDCCAGLTDSLRDLLLVRVEALPDHAQRVARITAEGGSTVEHALLAAVAGLCEDDLIEALRAAVGANILIAAPGGDGYRFRHALVREAVGDDLLPGERSRLNRRYAQALEAEPGLVPADQRATRLASYWYHAHDPAKALPAVLDAAVEARSRHAYSEQLRLLERAMELWDAAPGEVLTRLRPVDYAEAYPPCGCDPETTPLKYLDLMAEAAVVGRLSGERERALKITRRALRLLEEDPDPLREAWFWVQRSKLLSALGRGDGWQELSTAQDLVRGLPPSSVHAEVLASVAGWYMLHEPGPEAIDAAQRAMEYARMVGAEEIEYHARLDLGGLMVGAGDIEAGLAEMREVTEQVVARRIFAEVGRSHVNLPSALESVGRSAESATLLREGLRIVKEWGLRNNEPWIWANLAESLISLGRWDEGAEAAFNARYAAQATKPRGAGFYFLAHLALARGRVTEAARYLAEGRASFGPHDRMPQYVLPFATLSLALAAAEGRIDDARTELTHVLDDGLAPHVHRDAWPLLLAAASAEADAREASAAHVLRILETARKLATPAPMWCAYDLWVRAELHRAQGRDTVDEWSDVVTAFECLERPYDLARVRYRLAENLVVSGGDDDRARAADLLGLVRAVADHLKARPLLESTAHLTRRARLTPPPTPTGSLGLTTREHDVLRLVSAGHTNRQIAEHLFISPKTASVHVSNILAKLSVSSRGEAAALAHRLGLFPVGAA
ncbi:helix-turn-helix transcriptional regulator [Streptomyces acidiscabies]|uniref:AAA family ATPase n=1 Tax=Streptomyces acidiscabies TaxID=42234 RepID=A0AAP6EK68_9ACTN|nr:helix-turn-helix transcriptional regulator [Streptomyces acidiscabies]MBP5936634.1 AAA family ATPase [Streptomyces sp. LBUM 1476]MBZ3915370.1 AAA family ATPase [Streptomyces acidiscabies]MDX2965972.1 AAA family ATPase [Streptomyces acidiscabies]MDX3025048.1 AAA family ATPase [Streptomyces acidiscabies]MDX3795347.1 AAA family ATPase [Streptomyces acidiscabies]